ncbi:MAG: hypothetical protein ACI8RP_002031 [Urechidicola sp.]|jgi:hypothetical protein
MKSNKRKYQLPIILFIVATTVFSSCSNKTTTVTKQPTLSDYNVGEQWTWKYKGVTDKGEVRSNGEDARSIVSIDGDLSILVGKDTVSVSDLVKPELSETPRYKWPLEVGKKWKYEKNWTSQDGTTGKQSQDAEVLSYKEETVGAGTFMAYTIQYKGRTTNSRGYDARTDEVWLYAPEIKNFIKLTQSQDDFLYNEELIKYSNPNKK